MRGVFLLLLSLGLALATACSKSPPALTLEDLPAAITKSFQSARLQVKKNAEAIAKLIQDRQYALASIQLQALSAHPDLTKEQRDVLAAGMVAVNQTLQAQAETIAPAPSGDTESPKPPPQPVSTEEAATAAAALEHYKATK